MPQSEEGKELRDAQEGMHMRRRGQTFFAKSLGRGGTTVGLVAKLALGFAILSAPVAAQDLPRGQIINEVKCAADPSQSYALYLPSNYTPERAWSLLVGFHPAARGRAMVETYQAAAEKYGYVVAGSNNSRNGPWELSAASIQAM